MLAARPQNMIFQNVVIFIVTAMRSTKLISFHMFATLRFMEVYAKEIGEGKILWEKIIDFSKLPNFF
jgi:hypothetical protein